MIPINETSENECSERWLDGWFEPRWQAVLIWLTLAGVSGAVIDTRAFQWGFDNLYGTLIKQTARLGLAVPGGLREIIAFCNVFVLMTWFHPVALRLNLSRTLIWLAICTTCCFAFFIIEFRYWDRLGVLFFTAGPGIAGLALIGWRTRPLMSVVASVLAACVVQCLLWFQVRTASGPYWLILMAVNLPYALVMIYGTKPLAR
jgi:hypothetical protein